MSSRKQRRADRDLSRPVSGSSGQDGAPLPVRTAVQINNNVFLPRSPADYATLEKLDPGRAAKILQLQEDIARSNLLREERQTNHRIKIEDRQLTHDHRAEYAGLAAAFTLGIVGMGSATYLGIIGQSAACIGIATVVCGSLATAFITGKRMNAAERQGKLRALLGAKPGTPNIGNK